MSTRTNRRLQNPHLAPRLQPIANLFLLCGTIVSASGCFSPWFSKGDRNLSEMGERRENIREKLGRDDRPTIIGQIANPAQLTQLPLENIALVSQLDGTGGPVTASQQREKMLNTMRLHRDTNRPNAVLDDPSTALVVTSTVVGPAAVKGDSLDISVRLSAHAEGSDLRGGWLMETPLMEMSLLGGKIREGFELAKAKGHLVTAYQMTGEDTPEARIRALVVGGGQLLKGRELGLNIVSEYADAITMKAIVPEINQRFTLFDGRAKTGVATPRDNNFVAIKTPRRYRYDPHHYLNVIMQLGFNESAEQETERMALLQKQLQEPTTVRAACWQLEAIGEKSIPLLTAALDSQNPEIRFYAAHSLAYLNEKRPIAELVQLCHQEPAFRAMCLNGLTIIESFEAEDALRELVHAANAEVKYGAVRALRRRDQGDPAVRAAQVGETGLLLEIPSNGPPLVAVSLSQTPEVVLFGGNPKLHVSEFHYVNPKMMITPTENGELRVSHFKAGESADAVATAKPTLTSVLRAIAEVNGSYGDWVSFIRDAHEKGMFIEPVAINPVPNAGRTYNRRQSEIFEAGDEMVAETVINDFEQESDKSRSWLNPFGS